MAAPMKNILVRKLTTNLRNFRCLQPKHASKTYSDIDYTLRPNTCKRTCLQRPYSTKNADAFRLGGICRISQNYHNVSLATKRVSFDNKTVRNFATSACFKCPEASDDNRPTRTPAERPPPERPLHLMKFRELIWPHPLKTVKNWFLSFLISGYMDRAFTPKLFLEGAQQAIAAVSNLISVGKFDELEGLVTRDAINEIRQSYQRLTTRQRQMLAVKPQDIYFKFIYEIGMIFEDDSDKRFVEITAVFQGFKDVGLARERGETPSVTEMDKASENMYICNYRFIREYTKEVQESSDWTINKLNHFCPRDVVKNTDFFSR